MINVAIIEDNKAYSQAMHHLINNEEDLCIVYSSHNCNNLVEAIKENKPDVIILDIEMPGMNGVEAAKLVKDAVPVAHILMLTTFEDDDKIFSSIKNGASGYMLKNDPPENIIDAIRKVNMGESVMNGRVAKKVLQYFSAKQHNADKRWDEFNLTSREKQIVELLIKGLSYKEIATESFISNATVFSHVRNIYAKLGVHSRGEITAKFDGAVG